MISLPSRLSTASPSRSGHASAAAGFRWSTTLAAAVCLLAVLPCARAQITARITSPPENISVVAGQTIQLSASIRDPGATAEQIQFIIKAPNQPPNGRSLLQFPLNGPFVRDFTLPSQPGSYQLILNVTDTAGNLTTDQRTTTVAPADETKDPAPDTTLLTQLTGRTIQARAVVVLTATAESQRPDGGLLGRVDFYADNTLIASYNGSGKRITAASHDSPRTSAVDEDGPADNGSVFSATWSVPVTDGFVNLFTVATTRVGRSRVSGVVPVRVTRDTTNQPPSVSILNIVSGDQFSFNKSLNVPITASDPDRVTRPAQPGSVIAQVSNYVNLANINTPLISPYGFPFKLNGVGTYVINSIATDGLGLSTVAVPVIIRGVGVTSVTLVNPSNPLIPENGGIRRIQVVRTGDLSRPLTVRYRTSGSAVAGKDYQRLSGTVTFAAGASSVRIVVRALSDRTRDGNKSLTLLLSPGSYVEGAVRRVPLHIIDAN